MHGSFALDKVINNDATVMHIGPYILWLYVIISNILLVNLLIAMMSETYTEVKEHASVEFMFSRISAVLEMVERTHVMPPPFSLPVLAVQLLYTLIDSLLQKCGLGSDLSKIMGSDGKPTEWSAGGFLFQQKMKLQEVTQDAMRRHKRSREAIEGQSEATRIERWDRILESLVAAQQDTNVELQEMREEMRELAAARGPNRRFSTPGFTKPPGDPAAYV